MQFRTTSEVPVSDAGRYLKQLCRHFGHKVEATFTDDAGTVRFDDGVAQLTAVSPELLRISVDAPSADAAARYAGVVDRHLVKFAFREELQLSWSEPRQLV